MVPATIAVPGGWFVMGSATGRPDESRTTPRRSPAGSRAISTEAPASAFVGRGNQCSFCAKPTARTDRKSDCPSSPARRRKAPSPSAIAEGGLAAIGATNERKAVALYAEIDRTGFYRGTADKGSRSRMNITFRLPSEALENTFVKESTAAGFDGLKGHRSVGGLRASIYNAFPEEGVKALVEFMRAFERKHG